MSFPCEKCGKTFNRKDNLTRHLARKIDCTGESLADKMQALKLEIVSEVKASIMTENPKTWTDPETGLIYDIVNKNNIDLIKVPVNMKVCYKIIPPKRGKKDKKVSVSYEAIVQPKKTKKVKATSLQDDEDVSEETLKVVDTKFITNLLKRCHQLIYNNNPLGVESPEILHDFTRLLFLVMIQSKLDNSLKTLIDVELYQKLVKVSKKKFLPWMVDKLRVPTLIADSSDIFADDIKIVWHLLSMHPLTKDVFESGGKFKCDLFNLQAILKELYDHMADIKFDELEHDIKGQMFEYFVNEYCQGGGKERGAYFTPRKYCNLMLQLTNELCPEECKNVETIYDPYMGSGGILVALDRFKKGELKPENIYGGERTCNTYMIALMNLILAKASTCYVRRCDSLADNRGLQFDWIATNVPFGVTPDTKMALENPDFTETNYDGDLFDTSDLYNVGKSFKESLFIQHCVNKLAEGGVCSMIVPCGQFLYGRNGLTLRKYIVDNFTLKAVAEVEGGVFKTTSIGTAILIFTNEGAKHTTDVKFYEIKKDLACYTLKGTVTYEQLKEKKYVLLYKYYEITKEMDYSYEIKTLGEVCDITIGFTPSTENTEYYENGKHIWISIADMNQFIVNDSKTKITDKAVKGKDKKKIKKGSVLLSFKLSIGKVCIAGCDLYTNEAIAGIIPKDSSINIKFLAYYLKTSNLYEKASGLIGAGNLNYELLQEIQIPVPSLEVQQIIIDDYEKYQLQIDCIDKLIESSQDLVPVLQRRQLLPLFKSDETKTLGEVCLLENGERITKENQDGKEKKYHVYGGGDKTFMTDKFNRTGKTCKIGRFGPSEHNCVQIINESYWLTDNGMTIKANDDSLLNEYLWCYLLSRKSQIYDLSNGSAQGNIDIEQFKEIQIPVPSLEIQQEIISRCEATEKQIHDLTVTNIEGPSKNKIYFIEQQKKLFEM
jgi:type I restriction-modification system DNA methylase subunit/restriction endonuclease S subunit